jgi:hypothetical protein
MAPRERLTRRVAVGELAVKRQSGEAAQPRARGHGRRSILRHG